MLKKGLLVFALFALLAGGLLAQSRSLDAAAHAVLMQDLPYAENVEASAQVVVENAGGYHIPANRVRVQLVIGNWESDVQLIDHELLFGTKDTVSFVIAPSALAEGAMNFVGRVALVGDINPNNNETSQAVNVLTEGRLFEAANTNGWEMDETKVLSPVLNLTLNYGVQGDNLVFSHNGEVTVYYATEMEYVELAHFTGNGQKVVDLSDYAANTAFRFAFDGGTVTNIFVENKPEAELALANLSVEPNWVGETTLLVDVYNNGENAIEEINFTVDITDLELHTYPVVYTFATPLAANEVETIEVYTWDNAHLGEITVGLTADADAFPQDNALVENITMLNADDVALGNLNITRTDTLAFNIDVINAGYNGYADQVLNVQVLSPIGEELLNQDYTLDVIAGATTTNFTFENVYVPTMGGTGFEIAVSLNEIEGNAADLQPLTDVFNVVIADAPDVQPLSIEVLGYDIENILWAGQNYNLQVTVENLSAEAVSNVPIKVYLGQNGEHVINDVLAGPIAAGETAEFTFEGVEAPAFDGQELTYRAVTVLENDGNVNNDATDWMMGMVYPLHSEMGVFTFTNDHYYVEHTFAVDEMVFTNGNGYRIAPTFYQNGAAVAVVNTYAPQLEGRYIVELNGVTNQKASLYAQAPATMDMVTFEAPLAGTIVDTADMALVALDSEIAYQLNYNGFAASEMGVFLDEAGNFLASDNNLTKTFLYDTTMVFKHAPFAGKTIMQILPSANTIGQFVVSLEKLRYLNFAGDYYANGTLVVTEPVVVGDSLQTTLNFTNTGTADIVITDVNLNGSAAFTYSFTEDVTIAAGATYALPIQFKPATEGDFTAKLWFATDPAAANPYTDINNAIQLEGAARFSTPTAIAEDWTLNYNEDAEADTVNLRNYFGNLINGEFQIQPFSTFHHSSASLVSDTLVVLSFNANAFGCDTLLFNVQNGSSAYAEVLEQNIVVQIASVNDEPTLATPIADVTFDQYSGMHYLQVSGNFADVEDASLTYSVAGPDFVTVSNDTLAVNTDMQINFAGNPNKMYDVVVTAADDDAATIVDTFQLTIEAYPVLLNPVVPFTTMEGAAQSATGWDFTQLLANAHTDSIGFSWNFAHNYIGIFNYPVDELYYFTAENEDFNGVATFTLTATFEDSIRGAVTVQKEYTVNVVAVNDAPTLEIVADSINTDEDVVVTVAFNAADVDLNANINAIPDTLTYSWNEVAGIDNVIFGQGEAMVYLTPDFNGTIAEVVFNVHDQAGLTAMDAFKLVVEPVNDAPRAFVEIPDQTILANVIFAADMQAIYGDVDANDPFETLTFAFAGLDTTKFALNYNEATYGLTVEMLENAEYSDILEITISDTNAAVFTDAIVFNILPYAEGVAEENEEGETVGMPGTDNMIAFGMAFPETFYMTLAQGNGELPVAVEIFDMEGNLMPATLPLAAQFQHVELPEGLEVGVPYQVQFTVSAGEQLFFNVQTEFTMIQGSVQDQLNFTHGSATDLFDSFAWTVPETAKEIWVDDTQINVEAIFFNADAQELLTVTDSYYFDPADTLGVFYGLEEVIVVIAPQNLGAKYVHGTQGAYALNFVDIIENPNMRVVHNGADITDSNLPIDYHFTTDYSPIQDNVTLRNVGKGWLHYWAVLQNVNEERALAFEAQPAVNAHYSEATISKAKDAAPQVPVLEMFQYAQGKLWGMDFVEGKLWNVDPGNYAAADGKLRSIDAATGDAVETMINVADPAGVAQVGNALYITDWATGHIFKYDAETKMPLDTLVYANISEPSGISYDGTNLWVVEYEANKLMKLNEDVALEYALPNGIASCEGLEYVGDNMFWTTNGRYIYKLQVTETTLTLVESVDFGSYYITGLAWDGMFLWAANMMDKAIYQLDVEGFNAPEAIDWLTLVDANGDPIDSEDGSLAGFADGLAPSNEIRYQIDMSQIDDIEIGAYEACLKIFSTDPNLGMKTVTIQAVAEQVYPALTVHPDTVNITVPFRGTGSTSFAIANTGLFEFANWSVANVTNNAGDALSIAPMSGGVLNNGYFVQVLLNFDATDMAVNDTFCDTLVVTAANEAISWQAQETVVVNVTVEEPRPLTIYVNDYTAQSGEEIEVPVMLGGLVNLRSDIMAFQFDLAFNDSVEVVEYMYASLPLSGWTLNVNEGFGTLSVAAAGTTPWTFDENAETDTLVVFHFGISGVQGASTALTLSNVLLNEGQPTTEIENGSVTVEDNYLRGDVNLDGIIGTVDASNVLRYTVNDPSVMIEGIALANADATNDWTGMLDTLNYNDLTISAYDAYYILYYVTNENTWPMEARADNAQLAVNAMTVAPNAYFTMPVKLTGEMVNAANFTLRFNDAMLALQSVEVASENVDLKAIRQEAGAVHVSLVSLQGIEEGTVVNFHFQAQAVNGEASVRCENIAANGSSKEDIQAKVQIAVPVAQEVALGQNYPNPFNPETQISFNIPQAGHVTLKVYNIAGQLVRTLVDSEMVEGVHTVKWNGTNNHGSDVATGVYFYRLEANSKVCMKKMVLMK